MSMLKWNVYFWPIFFTGCGYGHISSDYIPSLNSCESATTTISTTIFSYTGSLQSFSVPSNCACLEVKAWGGGGDHNVNGGAGGGGGFVKGTFPITSNSNLSVYVAGRAVGRVGGWGYANGGTAPAVGWPGGGGGGASAVSSSSDILALAGGGGGGGGAMVNNTLARQFEAAGGAGGAENGTANGTCGSPTGRTGGQGGFSGSNGGAGGAGASGGESGLSGAVNPGTGGTGANPSSDDASGGGGGGGFIGGGGGGTGGAFCIGAGGGGGGSNYVNSSLFVSNAVQLSGTGITPGGTSDSEYSAGVAVGASYDGAQISSHGKVILNCKSK